MQTIYTIGLGLEVLVGICFAIVLLSVIGISILNDFGPRSD